MNITVNGSSMTLSEPPFTVAALIATLGFRDKRIAVELNENIVPRSQHEQQALREGDRVEIVHAIGGG